MNSPEALRYDEQWDAPIYTACARCDHGKTGKCTRPEVQGRGQPVEFSRARQHLGSCGPDAYYLNFPNLYRPGEAP